MTNSNPLVFVGIPAYNRPEGLRNTLKAITGQSYQHLEIHISNDASPNPEVISVLEEYQQADDRIKIYHQNRNLGIIENQRFLLSKVSSDVSYVMWACDDDNWHPDYIKACIEALEKEPQALLCTTSLRYFSGKTEVEIDHFEYVNTLNIEAPIKRSTQILNNILWWNHAFYGVFRKEAFTLVPLRHQFAFDISFILELSIHGEFIQLPYRYFYKTLDGNGSNVKSNLGAIKVKNRFVRLAPELGAAFGFIKNIWLFYGQLSRHEKYQLSKVVLRECLSNEMYPNATKFIWNRILNWKSRLKGYLDFKKDYRRIPDKKLLKKLYQQRVPINEISLLEQSQDKIKIHKLGVTVGLENQLLQDCHDLIKLTEDCDITFKQDSINAPVTAHFKNYAISLKAGFYGFLIREILVKESYSVHLTAPTIVFDIGANVGLAALYYAYQSQVEKVYGFEPFTETINSARETINLNPKIKDKIELFECGLSNQKLSKTVDYSFQYGQLASTKDNKVHAIESDQLSQTTIQLEKASEILNELILKHPDKQKVLKIDCEGSEYEIIDDLSSHDLLKNFNFILLEWHEEGDAVLLNSLHENGFKAFSISKDYTYGYGKTGMIYAINTSSKHV